MPRQRKKILFLVPYPPGEAPSQRFRFEQYLHMLGQHGYAFRLQSFTATSDWRVLYAQGRGLHKLLILFRGFFRRLFMLATLPAYDIVFIHREVAPLGPPVFEWLIAKAFRKKIIYDFDDAIWLTDKTRESLVERMLRWRSKAGLICRWSYRISCGNAYLADYARQFNNGVVVNPTTIDTETLHNPKRYTVERDPSLVIIGWTGSHSTLKYLNGIVPVIQHLEEKFKQVEFLVIADRNPELPLRRITFIPWSKENEARDLLKMDIGIMPLPDDKWTRGKCGFKALQYLAVEIPCVASPVGVNTEIIDHGVNGFLANNTEEWLTCMEKLINDVRLRAAMGREGRKKVEALYYVSSNASRFLSLFEG
jgi:glycosyltransferase involved in cell wall biosynthesis